jgi:hypothetical protein
MEVIFPVTILYYLSTDLCGFKETFLSFENRILGQRKFTTTGTTSICTRTSKADLVQLLTNKVIPHRLYGAYQLQ